MEKYPYLNEAVACILSRRRNALAMSKRKLSEEDMIERAYISSLEAGRKCPTLNVLFYICEALDMSPVEFMTELMKEIRRFGDAVQKQNRKDAQENGL